MSTDGGQATLDEFTGSPNAPEKPRCQGTADHTGERCERVATVAGVVCPLHHDQLQNLLDNDGSTDGAQRPTGDGGASIPRRPGAAASDN